MITKEQFQALLDVEGTTKPSEPGQAVQELWETAGRGYRYLLCELQATDGRPWYHFARDTGEVASGGGVVGFPDGPEQTGLGRSQTPRASRHSTSTPPTSRQRARRRTLARAPGRAGPSVV